MAYDVIVVGHVAIDVNKFPWGVVENVLGGAPTYSGLALVALKKSVGVSSKIGLDFTEKFPPIYGKLGLDTEGIIVAGEYTTTFENTYDEKGKRTQICKHMTPPIAPDDIPGEYSDAKGFYFSPIVNEVTPELVKSVKKSSNVVMLDPQGILREIGKDGRVTVRPRELGGYLKYVDIVKIGMDELGILGDNVEDSMKKLRAAGPKIVIATKGGEPLIVLSEEGTLKLTPLKVDAKDTTGAGDVFGAAFLSKYLISRNVSETAKFATAAAGLKVRYRGPIGFPSEQEILQAVTKL